MIYEGDDGALVVQFGQGDVGVLTGILEGHPEIRAIELMHSVKSFPIGDEMLTPEVMAEYHKNQCTSEELGYEGFCPGVRLLFDKVESIDVVIWALNKIREELLFERDIQEVIG